MQNTAIFYDIENLIGGYSNPESVARDISLKEILDKIKAIDFVGGIGIQRAYANWSDPRLRIIGQEISQLGIEPIQIFGLSRNQKKNAADIQLAVDAIDLAYVRPWLDVFVIVSGDGGFSALAKKLHECGRKVIGCAYKSATNQIFESVCDVFITLEEPHHQNTFEKKIYNKVGVGNPLAVKISKNISPLSSNNKNQIIEHSQKIINLIINDNECIERFNRNGINLGIIREIFKSAIKDFNIVFLGFSKFVDFFSYISSDTNLVTILMPNNEMKIVFSDNSLTHNILLKNSDDLLCNLKITNQIVKRMANDLERLSSENANEIIEHSKSIINWLANDNESRKAIEKQGIGLSVIKEAFKYGIENFDPRLVGFGRFTEFLQYITTNTNFVISRSKNNTTAITYRHSSLDGLDVFPDLDETYIHSPDNYSAILATGNPIFRTINKREQYNTISIIFGLEDSLRSRDSLFDYLNQENIQYEPKLVNCCITNLINSNVLDKQSNADDLSDVNLTINPDFRNIDSIVEKILNSMRQKLLDFFDDEFQEDVFEQLINS